MNIKAKIANAFDRAVETYETSARIQRHVAQHLASWVKRLPLPRNPKILEIGCGTGLLTQEINQIIPEAEWTLTDISPTMLRKASLTLDRPCVSICMDGERLAIHDRFDLIVSSLALQWFENLDESLSKLVDLLNLNGWLAIAMLTEGTLSEWKEALTGMNIPTGSLQYHSMEDLLSMLDDRADWIHYNFRDQYVNTCEFLRSLKKTGTHTPIVDYIPLTPGTMRSIVREIDARGKFNVTYEVAFGFLRKDT